MRISGFFLVLFLVVQADAQIVSPAAPSKTLSQRLRMDVTTLMEISLMSELQVYYAPGTYPESGLQNHPGNMDSFRVRANHSFIVSVTQPDTNDINGFALEMKKNVNTQDIPAVCVAIPLSDAAQRVSFTCYCSTDQWFIVRRNNDINNTPVLLYTTTGP
jgi:hypothetical protein